MKQEMPAASPSSPLVRAKTKSWVALWTPVFHIFSPLMTHSSPSRSARVSIQVASEPWFGSVRPKAMPAFPASIFGIHSSCWASEPYFSIISTVGKLPTIGRLVLQVVEQPEPLGGQVLADHRHVEVRPAPATEALGQVVAEEPCLVGGTAHLAEQRLPLLVGQTVPIPVRAGILAPVVEEPLVVVTRLDRCDDVLDEGVELGEQGDEMIGQPEVHGGKVTHVASRRRPPPASTGTHRRGPTSPAPHCCDKATPTDSPSASATPPRRPHRAPKP